MRDVNIRDGAVPCRHIHLLLLRPRTGSGQYCHNLTNMVLQWKLTVNFIHKSGVGAPTLRQADFSRYECLGERRELPRIKTIKVALDSTLEIL